MFSSLDVASLTLHTKQIPLTLKERCLFRTKFQPFDHHWKMLVLLQPNFLNSSLMAFSWNKWECGFFSDCLSVRSLCRFWSPPSSLGTCTAVLEVGSWAPRPAAGGQLSCLAQLCQLTSAEHPTWSLAKALSWPLCFVFLYPAATVRVRDNSDDESNGCHREIRAWWRGQMSSTRVSEVFTITHFPYRSSLIQICIKG